MSFTIRTPAEIYEPREEKPQPDGVGAKFVVSEAPQLLHSPIQSECSAGVNERVRRRLPPNVRELAQAMR